MDFKDSVRLQEIMIFAKQESLFQGIKYCDLSAAFRTQTRYSLRWTFSRFFDVIIFQK